MITTDWTPTTDHEQQAKVLALDLEAEADAFREYNRSVEIRNPDRAFSGWLRKSTRGALRMTPAAKPNGYHIPPAGTPEDPLGGEVGRWIEANPDRAEQLRLSIEDRRQEGNGPKGKWAAEVWTIAEMRSGVLRILERERMVNA